MTETEEKRSRPNVSVVQLGGGALAALSAAVVASTLGVEGTILGAALGSVVATAGGAWYSWSLERTQERLRTSAQTIVATARSRSSNGRSVAAETAAARSSASAGDGTAGEGAESNDGAPAPAEGYQEVGAESAEGPTRRPPWKKLAIGAVGAFLIAMAAILVFELATGQPLAATVRGEPASGTSVNPRTDDAPAPAPAESPTESSSPAPEGTEGPEEATPTPRPSATEEPTEMTTPTQTPAAPTSSPRSTATAPQETPPGR